MFNTKRAQLNAEELEKVVGGTKPEMTSEQTENGIPRGGKLGVRV